jgi:hypothetical protein
VRELVTGSYLQTVPGKLADAVRAGVRVSE